MKGSDWRLITPLAFICTCIAVTPTSAASFTDLGHAAGPQCITADVNDDGETVGNCSSSAPNANNAAWVSTSASPDQQPLPSLVGEQPCYALSISTEGWIVGVCAKANNTDNAVLWDAASPATPPKALTPLPSTLLFPLLRPADVATLPTAFNQRGDVVGLSLNKRGVATSVLYKSGNPTPVRISDWDSNCHGVSVNETLINAYPSIAMNCPGEQGVNIARVVTRGATGYTTTDLPVPNGATSCVVLAINDQLQAVGTCLYSKSATNVPKTAFWNTPTSSPNLLTLPLNAQNSAVALNNNGHVLAFSADIQGTVQLLYWEDTTSSFGVQPIDPPQGAVQLNFVGFADNDRVALNSVDTDEYSTSCTWDPVNGAAGIVCLLPINGGKKSKLTSISTDGKYAAGINIDADQDAAAVRVTLP